MKHTSASFSSTWNCTQLFSNLSPALFNNTLHTSSPRHTPCPPLLQFLRNPHQPTGDTRAQGNTHTTPFVQVELKASSPTRPIASNRQTVSPIGKRHKTISNSSEQHGSNSQQVNHPPMVRHAYLQSNSLLTMENLLYTPNSLHTLYSTPTLQDITTVENDLKRSLAHFENFLDHVTDHINNYESLRSFNQQVSNIINIQTFKELINRWPQFDTLIATTWEIDNNNVLSRSFAHVTHYLINPNMVTYLQMSNLAGAMHITSVSPEKEPKGDKGKEKSDKGKGRGLGRFVYWDAEDIPTHKPQRTEHQVSSAVHELVDDAAEQQLDDTPFIHSRISARSSASVAHQVHGSNTSSPLTISTSNPDPPKLYYYCNYHGRVISNDSSFERAPKEATSPTDTSPMDNTAIEPLRTDGRKRPFLKAWRAYSN